MNATPKPADWRGSWPRPDKEYIRYVATYIDKHGSRTLMCPNQGRNHWDDPKDAQAWIDGILKNTDEKSLAEFWGGQSIGTYEVRPVRCYAHGDAMEVYFNEPSLLSLSLSLAEAGGIQDAWHYAMLLVEPSRSTFCGSREYHGHGILDQFHAYEALIQKLDKMSDAHDTWEFRESTFFKPASYKEMCANAAKAVLALEAKATSMGICAHTARPKEDGS